MPYDVNKSKSNDAFAYFSHVLLDAGMRTNPDEKTNPPTTATASAPLGLGAPLGSAVGFGAPTLGSSTYGSALGAMGGQEKITPSARLQKILDTVTDKSKPEAGHHFVNLSRGHLLLLLCDTKYRDLLADLKTTYNNAATTRSYKSAGNMRPYDKHHAYADAIKYLFFKADNSAGIIPIIRMACDQNILFGSISAVGWRKNQLDIKNNGAINPEKDMSHIDTGIREFLEENAIDCLYYKTVNRRIAERAIELGLITVDERQDFIKQLNTQNITEENKKILNVVLNEKFEVELSSENEMLLEVPTPLKQHYRLSLMVNAIIKDSSTVRRGLNGQLNPGSMRSDDFKREMLTRACYAGTSMYLTITEVLATNVLFSTEQIQELLSFISQQQQCIVAFFAEPFVKVLRECRGQRNQIPLPRPLLQRNARDKHVELYKLWRARQGIAKVLFAYSDADLKLLCDNIESKAQKWAQDNNYLAANYVEYYLRNIISWDDFFKLHLETTLTHTENLGVTTVPLVDYADALRLDGSLVKVKINDGVDNSTREILIFDKSKDDLIKSVSNDNGQQSYSLASPQQILTQQVESLLDFNNELLSASLSLPSLVIDSAYSDNQNQNQNEDEKLTPALSNAS